MIAYVARASMEGVDSTHLFGIWSDIIVGERAAGLVDFFLLRGGCAVHVHAVWESREADDHGDGERWIHPAFGFFEACGVDPNHVVYEVIGRMA